MFVVLHRPFFCKWAPIPTLKPKPSINNSQRSLLQVSYWWSNITCLILPESNTWNFIKYERCCARTPKRTKSDTDIIPRFWTWDDTLDYSGAMTFLIVWDVSGKTWSGPKKQRDQRQTGKWGEQFRRRETDKRGGDGSDVCQRGVWLQWWEERDGAPPPGIDWHLFSSLCHWGLARLSICVQIRAQGSTCHLDRPLSTHLWDTDKGGDDLYRTKRVTEILNQGLETKDSF